MRRADVKCAVVDRESPSYSDVTTFSAIINCMSENIFRYIHDFLLKVHGELFIL